MLSSRELSLIAGSLIHQMGERAVLFAGLQAIQRLEACELGAHAEWMRVVREIDRLLSVSPDLRLRH